jgi:PAS domain S-box-containing protein
MVQSKKIKKLRILFILLFLIFLIFSFLITDYIKNKYITNELNNKSDSYLKIYNTVYNQYKEMSEVFLSGVITMNQLDEKLLTYQESTENVQKLIRDNLYKNIQKRYETLKEKHITSINIILPDNTFLLVMKDPKKYNFQASKLRTDITYVNKTKKPFDSFNIGKGGSGFRFLHPIFNKEKYVGLICFTFDASAITSSIMKQYYVLSNFYFKKDYFTDDFLSKSKIYKQSPHKGYLHNTKVLNELKKATRKDIEQLIPSNTIREKTYKNFSSLKVETIIDKQANITITTIPIINKIDKTIQSILTIRAKAENIKSYLWIINLINILIILIVCLLLYLFYKIISEKEALKFEVKKKTNQLQEINDNLEHKIEKNTEELKKRNSELIQQKDFLNALIETSPVPFFIKNIDGKYMNVNKIWCEFTGFTKKEILNKSVYDVAPKDIADIYYKQDLKVFNLEENPQVYESHVVNKNTKVVHDVIFYKSAFFDEKGEVAGLIGTLLDLTRIKALEEEKIKKEKLILEQSKFVQMGEMIGNIAHQWRQPLSLISTVTSGLKLDFELDKIEKENSVKNLQTVLNTVVYLSDTINQFSNFIKEDRTLTKVKVQDRILEVLKILDAALKNNHININLQLNEETPLYVELVIGELSQVLINIITNSKDAYLINKISTNKIINIKSFKKDDYAYIVVEDYAGGIKEDIISKIFDPYFTTKHQYQGTGLGLYICKDIIEKHLKGKISAKNTKKGVEFIIKLKLVK